MDPTWFYDWREWRRFRGLELARQGWVHRDIAAALGVSEAAVSQWLAHVRQDPSDWAVVVSDDDDLIPPIFVAESWLQPYGGRVFLLSGRRLDKTFLRLDGLLLDSPYGS